MPSQVTVAVARAHKAPLVLEILELDNIRPNEARVRLDATGVCHPDAFVRDGIYPVALPAVLGHEGPGIVEQVGSAAITATHANVDMRARRGLRSTATRSCTRASV